jgi:hypothetical protein
MATSFLIRSAGRAPAAEVAGVVAGFIILSSPVRRGSVACSICFTASRKAGRGKREEGRGKREEGRGKREEGRGKREEGRGKREEGRGKREEAHTAFAISRSLNF